MAWIKPYTDAAGNFHSGSYWIANSIGINHVQKECTTEFWGYRDADARNEVLQNVGTHLIRCQNADYDYYYNLQQNSGWNFVQCIYNFSIKTLDTLSGYYLASGAQQASPVYKSFFADATLG